MDAPRSTSYHQTQAYLPAEKVADYQRQASSQDDLILDLFESNPNQAFSPDAVHSLLFTPDTPITSVRRAITNWTRKGELEETGESVIGPHGRPVGQWRYKNPGYLISDLGGDMEPVDQTLEELERIETEVNTEAREAFYSIGLKLSKIRYYKLYRQAGFRSWSEYCKSDRVGYTKRHADNYIRAAELRPKLETNGFQEWNERQVRELTKCKTTDPVEVAKLAVEKAKGSAEKVTATLIAQVRNEIEGTDSDEDDEPEEVVPMQDALRAATRCKSVDAKYLSKKTGVKESKVKAWLELSEDTLHYKAKKLSDGTYQITRYKIWTDRQFITAVKQRKLEGDRDPVDVLSDMLDSIANTIEGVNSQYGPNCKSHSVWKQLPTERLAEYEFLLISAERKVAEYFPQFLKVIKDELLSR